MNEEIKEQLSELRGLLADSFQKYFNFEYTEAFQRAFLAGKYVVKKSDADIIQTLFSGSLNLRDTIILEEEPQSLKPQEGNGSAQIISYTPNKIVIETHADSPKLLFLSDVYDSGWTALLDGKQPSKILRADYDFRAVEVPEGTHTVEFLYRPTEFLYGIWIAMGSAVSLILISVSKKYYEDRHR